MKKLKSLIAGVMAAAMVLTMTGCDEEGAPNGGGSAPNANTNSTSGTTTPDYNMEYDDETVNNAAKALKDKLDNKDLKVENRLKWMSWWNIDETQGAAVLFKEVYGVPEKGSDDSFAGKIFEYKKVDYGSRFDNLSTAIAGDNSPDMFPFEIDDFPYGVLMNRYQAIDDIIDLNSEKWAPTKDLIDQFQLNGKHYAAFWEITLNSLMWYRKSCIESIGATDPQELFKQGKWDWDAFLEMCRKWQKTGTETDPKFGVDGWSVEDQFVASTGMPMIGNDGTQLVNNLHSAEVERALTGTGAVVTMQKENLRYPRHEVNDWDVNPAAWANGSTLFFCGGTWDYEQTLQFFKKKFKWAADEIKVVPFPKDPKADKYYVQVKVDTNMWVKGSTNKEGVAAWLDCCVTCAKDSTLAEASKQKSIKNPQQGWTQELLDFLHPLYARDGSSPLTPIVDFKRGLGPTVYDSQSMDSPVAALTGKVYIVGDSYVQLRDTHEGTINKAIEDINKKIKE